MALCRIAVIEPSNRTVVYKTVPDKDMSRAAGQELLLHTVVERGEMNYGLFNNPPQPVVPEYYALNSQLCHGTGVLYAFNREGATVDIPRSHPQPLWLGPIDNVAAAVTMGMVTKGV